jgi:sugar phosphate isomerase/epimerase
MVMTAINLYSVRELNIEMMDLLDRVADAGYDGVQFSGGLRGENLDAVAAKLHETGLEATGAHVSIEELEDDLEAIYERYAEILGCASVIVPYLGEKHFATERAFDLTKERLSVLVTDACAFDWPVHYHNHAHELAEIDGTTGLDRLTGIDGLGIELDVGWALVGGCDPVELIRSHADRINHLHLKDMDAETREFREIGEGDVNMTECAEAARAAGVEWFIYEHDQPTDPAASIQTGAEFVNSL